MSGSIGDREGGVANGNTTFPGEEPSEIQLHDWLKSYRQLLRQKQLLNFAETANPERLAEYKAGIPIPVDENASDAVKTAIAAKNATISTTNVERAAKWEDHKRQQNDKIAALLQESLDATASLRLTSLEKKHAFPAPHENMLNGGAMWRDLKDLKGTLNAEESEETSLAAWRHLAENHATPQQFAERLTEFDKHALSSTEAEIIAASACATEIIYVRTLLAEMGLMQESPTPLGVDNAGAVELARDRKSCNRSRHVDRRFFKVRELQASSVVQVHKIPTALNRSDVLTKALPTADFLRHRASLMDVPAESPM